MKSKRTLFLSLIAPLFILSSCQDTTDETTEPVAPPSPDFTASNTNCQAPCEVTFSALVNEADEYTWTFGDGDTSNRANPSHIYTEEGRYAVSLKVTNESGTEVIVKDITIDSGFREAAIQKITIRDFPITDSNGNGWDANSPPDLYVELEQGSDSLIVGNTNVIPNVVDSLDLPVDWQFSAPQPVIRDFDESYSFRLIDQNSDTTDQPVVQYTLPEDGPGMAPNPYPETVPIRNNDDEDIGSIELEWR